MSTRSDTSKINQLLEEVRNGSETAKEQLSDALYQLLKPIAHKYLRRERDGHSLQTSDLLHLTLVQAHLIDPAAKDWRNKAHLFGYAALTMRTILVDHARKLRRRPKVELEKVEEKSLADPRTPTTEHTRLEEALGVLRTENPRAAQIVVLRYYGGLTVDQVAEALNTNRTAVKRDWDRAKQFLAIFLSPP